MDVVDLDLPIPVYLTWYVRVSRSLFGGGVHCTLMDVEDRVVRITRGAGCELRILG